LPEIEADDAGAWIRGWTYARKSGCRLQEFRDDLPFYTKTLKMRLDMIYPADDPEVAVLSGHG
jgi:hypothetical protein